MKRKRTGAKITMHLAGGVHGITRGFTFRFVGGCILGQVLAAYGPIERVAIQATSSSLGLFTRPLGCSQIVGWNSIRMGSAQIAIVAECTSLTPTLILASALFAYPARLRSKLAGAALFAPLIWMFNLGRIVALAFVMNWKPALFDLAHLFLWQMITLLLIAAMFATWRQRQVTEVFGK